MMVELLCRGLTRIYIIIVHNINDRIKPFWSCKWREAVGGVGLGGRVYSCPNPGYLAFKTYSNEINYAVFMYEIKM